MKTPLIFTILAVILTSCETPVPFSVNGRGFNVRGNIPAYRQQSSSSGYASNSSAPRRTRPLTAEERTAADKQAAAAFGVMSALFFGGGGSSSSSPYDAYQGGEAGWAAQKGQ